MNKKWISLALAGLLLFGMAGCGEKKNDDPVDSSSSSSSEEETEEYTFENVLTDGTEVHLGANESKVYDINKDITGRNYIRIRMKTNANMLGKFTYQNVSNAAQIVEEEFFIEPSTEEIEFKQFLDSYRDNGVGLFDKKLISISLKNLDAHSAAVSVFSVAAADRDIPEMDKELYIEQGELKVGADLAMGGTLSYLERTAWYGESVQEYLDWQNNVCIGVGVESGDMQVKISDSVNLINICDAGREIQQSYYANVGGTKADSVDKVLAGDGNKAYSQENKPDDYGSNGYNRNWSYTADSQTGYYWPYNPVQGGDEVCNLSQIIDYETKDNYIYVKVRAMDWANGNAREEKNHPDREQYLKGRTTKSYIENWYTIKDNMLFVDNRFIDWNGFTNMDDIPSHSMEMPATYISHPLYQFVCYTGRNAWDLQDSNYYRNTECSGWVKNPDIQHYHPEDWFAWVNEHDFGVGMYIPGVGSYISGRDHTTRNISETQNRNAFASKMVTQYRYNKREPFGAYDSCYVGNTSYTAPVVQVRMKEYIPLAYSYVLAVDMLPQMRENFKEIYDSKTMLNEGLKAWD